MGEIFEAGLLPDSQKEALCRSLLDEFGASVNRVYDDELIHGCLLPWSRHKDQKVNPSASLNWSKLTYKCLGCGGGGGLLWFIAACRGTGSTEARKWLEKSQGLGTEVMNLSDLLRFFDALYESSSKSRGKAPIPRYDERVLAPWDLRHPYMFDPITEGGRGIPMSTLDKFKIGYAEDYKARLGEGFIDSERIVIPHFWQGDLVGWQTRRLGADGTAKYLSSPDFPKDQTVYNFDYMAQTTVVVESPLSVLAHDHHLHMEATFGASVTEHQLRLLTKHPRVVLWMDNDDAGWSAVEGTKDNRGNTAKTGMAEYLSRYADVRIVDSPWAADPADLPDYEVQQLVTDAVPYGLWARPRALREWEAA